MGVVPYGYADGFFRALSGRCAMMTADGPAPQRGVDDLALQANTIPYELTCAVSKRVPRVYLQDGRVVEKELLLRM